jgi:hypothetical protein
VRAYPAPRSHDSTPGQYAACRDIADDGAAIRPLIARFLTDDQDQKLGGSFPQINGVGPMPKTKEVLADKGKKKTVSFSAIYI